MTWIWTLPALLAGVLTLVFWPLFSRRGNLPQPPGLEGDPRVALEDQRDLLLRQLKELEYDQEAGTVAQADAQPVRQALEGELARVLGALDRTPPPGEGGTPGGRNPLDMRAGIALMLALALFSGGVYWAVGTPVAPEGGDGRGAAGEAGGMPGDMDAAIKGLAARMAGEPDNIEGWHMLARAYLVTGQEVEAIRAYAHILTRQPENLDAAVKLAELQIGSGDAELMALGTQMLHGVLARDASRPEALWLLGVLAYRDGDGPGAAAFWQRLLESLPADHPNRARVEEALNDARALPPAQPPAAAGP